MRKTINILLAAMLILISVSCDEDDNNSNLDVNETNVSGTYSLSAVFVEETETETIGGQTTVTIDRLEGIDFNNNVTFNLDGTLNSTGSYDYREETIVNGTVVESETDTEDLTDMGSFTVNTENRTVRIILDGDAEVWDVEELTLTSLILTQSEIEVDYSFVARIEYTRE